KQSLHGILIVNVILIEDWSHLQSQDKINLVIEMLITRSCGSIRKLAVTRLSGECMFCFIATVYTKVKNLLLKTFLKFFLEHGILL
ncbi:hypothetical protein MKW92_011325, partial [Papaver armeniacum]